MTLLISIKKFNNKERSYSQSRSRRSSLASEDDMCWFHRVHGSKALNCHSPCNSPLKATSDTCGGGRHKQCNGKPPTRLRQNDEHQIPRWLVICHLLIAKKFVKSSLQRQLLTLSASNLSRIDTYGTHSVILDLRLRWPFAWAFTVVNVEMAFFGADFLTHFNLVIDLQQQQLINALTSLSLKGFVIDTPVHGVSMVTRAVVAASIWGQRYISLHEKYPDITLEDGFTVKLPDLPTLHEIHTTGPPWRRCRAWAPLRTH